MSLDALQQSLDSLRSGALGVRDFSESARALSLPAELPPRFGEVLQNLCDRLESSALFDGESCSFSQIELLDAVQVLIDKARQRLAA